MMSCQEATRLISEGQDRRLLRAERLQLSLHTLMCLGCRRFEKQMGSLRHLVAYFARTPGAEDELSDQQDPH